MITFTNNTIGSSISKTALDALHAKLSAVNVGYQLVDEQSEVYDDYLDKISTHAKNHNNNNSSKGVRRQTPLVNAGYALRVYLVSKLLMNFLRSNCDDNSKKNVVLLGCGLDVTGLWAQKIFVSSEKKNVQLYEIDCREMAEVKKRSLMESKIIKGNEKLTDAQSSDIYMFQGHHTIVADDDIFENNNNYTLLGTDLRNMECVRTAFSLSGFDKNKPTIVISELVLAYLGQAPSEQLLKYISSDLIGLGDDVMFQNNVNSNNSMFLAYEPIGDNDSNEIGTMNVKEGYSHDYFRRFSSKISRGGSTEYLFSPLGRNASHARRRLQKCGFEGPIDCCSAMDVLLNDRFKARQFSPPELFDEHAALALHLQSYALICATNNATINNFLTINPWSTVERATKHMGQYYYIRPQQRLTTKNGNDLDFSISTIQMQHQTQVQNLFKSTYVDFFEEFPSVKKMVKNALKSDLSLKPIKRNTQDKYGTCDDTSNTEISPILQKYIDKGGSFWVLYLSLDHNLSQKEKQSPITKDVSSTATTPNKVIGCIGIHKSFYPKHGPSQNEEKSLYEINRLVIDANYRGNGLGKLLLDIASSFVQQKNAQNKHCFIAKTPDIMHSANSFYKSLGFKLNSFETLGKMRINTYCKQV